MMSRGKVESWLLAWVGAAALGAWAQSIKIPDFRQPPPPVSAAPGPGVPCDECGVIRSIREVHQQRKVEVPGAFRSDPRAAFGERNLTGAVVYLPLGGESDRSFVGGVGTPEMRERFTETTYEITVRLDNGAYRFIERRDGTRFQVGDRVRLSEGRVEPLAN